MTVGEQDGAITVWGMMLPQETYRQDLVLVQELGQHKPRGHSSNPCPTSLLFSPGNRNSFPCLAGWQQRF